MVRGIAKLRSRALGRWPLAVTIAVLGAGLGPTRSAYASGARNASPAGHAVSAHASKAMPKLTGHANDGLNQTACLYSSDHISMLNTFSETVNHSFQCAMVFNDASPSWQGWESPWFLHTYSDMNWGTWATAPGTARHLIITQGLFPTPEDNADWLKLGASGAFDSHARTLARNLVAAGLGSAVIRLANEANGIKYPYSIPATRKGDAEWVRFWDNTVTAMRSVPGAHFLFDWCVASGYRPLALSDFYPGNRYVDIVGVDVYDSGLSTALKGRARWSALYNQPDGLGAVAQFAAAHHKPMSIPEWGLDPSQEPDIGHPGGDDPTFVNGIASVVKDDDVAFQSYFDADYEGVQFFDSPHSLAAYRRHFGNSGDAVAAAGAGSNRLAPFTAPKLKITGGPAEASTTGPTVRFQFSVQSGYKAECSLDDAPFGRCTAHSSDTLKKLSSGFHLWRVQAQTSDGATAYLGRSFVIGATGIAAKATRRPTGT